MQKFQVKKFPGYKLKQQLMSRGATQANSGQNQAGNLEEENKDKQKDREKCTEIEGGREFYREINKRYQEKLKLNLFSLNNSIII